MKKSIYTSVIFVFLIGVSSFLIGISFSVEDSFLSLFDAVYTKTNSADYSAIFPRGYLDEKKEETDILLRKDDIITQYELEDALIFLKTPISVENKEELQGSWIIRNLDRKNFLSGVSVVEKIDSIQKNSIFVPYICKSLFGFRLGDELSIRHNGIDRIFLISGFTEDILYGNRGIIAFDVPEDMFFELDRYLGDGGRSELLLVKSEDELLKQYFIPLIKEAEYATYTDIYDAKFSMHSTLHIYGIVILSLSVVTLVVVCLVMYFRIRDSFYKDYKNIGVMKALGFSNTEIRLSYIFQYFLLSIIGGVIGIIFSILFSSTVVPSIAAESGMKWVNFFHIWRAVEIVLIDLIIVFIFAFFATSAIRKITPAAAIRGYNSNFNGGVGRSFFGRIPLSLNFLSALYLFISRKKQNIAITVIIALAVLSSSFFITLFTNVVQNENGLSQISGMEKFDIVLKARDGVNIDELYKSIENMKNTKVVIKCIGPGGGGILCDNIITGRITVYDDYEKIDKIGLYEGRYPFHDNEIAISVNLAKSLKKGVGDVILIRNDYQDNVPEEEYVVTGLTQGSYTGGLDVFFSFEGIKKIESEANWESIYVYLTEGTDIENTISSIKYQMKDEIIYIENFRTLFEGQFSSVIYNIKAVIGWVLSVSMFITLITVILLVKTVMLNNESDFGVMRAVGFTIYQIANQVSMSIIPVLIIASFIGYLLSLLFTNKILEIMLQGMGVYDLYFSLPNGYIACYIIVAILLSYLISLFYVYRQRKYPPNYIINREE